VHRWLEHTGEVELELEGGEEGDLFVAGLRALAEVLADDPGGPTRRVAVALEAADRGALLAEWLDELVFLSETEGFLPEGVVDLELGEQTLRATVEGRAARPRHLVKAVTYHRLALEAADDGVRARVTLDV
jgi:SHS2 domain-containing protein